MSLDLLSNNNSMLHSTPTTKFFKLCGSIGTNTRWSCPRRDWGANPRELSLLAMRECSPNQPTRLLLVRSAQVSICAACTSPLPHLNQFFRLNNLSHITDRGAHRADKPLSIQEPCQLQTGRAPKKEETQRSSDSHPS